MTQTSTKRTEARSKVINMGTAPRSMPDRLSSIVIVNFFAFCIPRLTSYTDYGFAPLTPISAVCLYSTIDPLAPLGPPRVLRFVTSALFLRSP
jgi:hypothetical protein